MRDNKSFEKTVLNTVLIIITAVLILIFAQVIPPVLGVCVIWYFSYSYWGLLSLKNCKKGKEIERKDECLNPL